jgi:hypothetical protein
VDDLVFSPVLLHLSEGVEYPDEEGRINVEEAI